jgi:hypothetical protein
MIAISIVLIFLGGCDLLTSKVTALFDGGFKLPPKITTNTITFAIDQIGYKEMRGYDNFPSITMYVKAMTIETPPKLITGLTEPDFFEAVDDNGDARPIYVTPPRSTAIADKKQVDVVFVIDTTGSMGSYLSTMTSKAQAFADKIAASGIDYRLGYVTFGDDIRKASGQRLAPTSIASTFKAAIGALTANGGGDGLENQIDALDYARAAPSETTSNPAGSFQNDMSFTYRVGAARMFILITDIGYHYPGETSSDVLTYYPTGVSNTRDAEITKLKADGVICFVVGPTGVGYEKIATDTGGKFFSTGGDFGTIVDTIGAAVAYSGDYQITYLTNDFTTSKSHTVRLSVHTSKGDGQATATYTSPSVVNYAHAKQMLEQDNAKHLKK